MEINDGTGTGYRAGVNSLNQVKSRAICSLYHQFVSCQHEQAYMAALGTEAKPTLTVTATGGYMMYLKNTSTNYDAVIARVTISTSALMLITIMKNPTIGVLGNETATVPVNKNFKSGKVADVDVYTWDEVGDQITGITSGDCAGTYQVNGFERVLFDESICLGLNDIIAIKAKNSGELSLTIHGYYIVPA
jgi:hypothetical protein